MAQFLPWWVAPLVFYCAGVLATAFVCGRLYPNWQRTGSPEAEEQGGLIMGACALWPLGICAMLAMLAFRQGQASVRWQPRRQVPQAPDGWHEYQDGKMLVRWREVA